MGPPAVGRPCGHVVRKVKLESRQKPVYEQMALESRSRIIYFVPKKISCVIEGPRQRSSRMRRRFLAVVVLTQVLVICSALRKRRPDPEFRQEQERRTTAENDVDFSVDIVRDSNEALATVIISVTASGSKFTWPMTFGPT